MIEILHVIWGKIKPVFAGKEEHWQLLCLNQKSMQERIVTEFNVGYQREGGSLTFPKALIQMLRAEAGNSGGVVATQGRQQILSALWGHCDQLYQPLWSVRLL